MILNSTLIHYAAFRDNSHIKRAGLMTIIAPARDDRLGKCPLL